jgi:hypothetical protein
MTDLSAIFCNADAKNARSLASSWRATYTVHAQRYLSSFVSRHCVNCSFFFNFMSNRAVCAWVNSAEMWKKTIASRLRGRFYENL